MHLREAPPILETFGRATCRVFGQQSRGPFDSLPPFDGPLKPGRHLPVAINRSFDGTSLQAIEITGRRWTVRTVESTATSGTFLRFRLQGSADQFFFVASKNMPVGICRRSPCTLSSAKRGRRFQQPHPADFVIAPVGQPRANQVPLVGEEQRGIAILSDVNARSALQVGHFVSLPNLPARACLKANQGTRRSGGEQVVASKEWSGRVAQDPLGNCFPFGPEYGCLRSLAI